MQVYIFSLEALVTDHQCEVYALVFVVVVVVVVVAFFKCFLYLHNICVP